MVDYDNGEQCDNGVNNGAYGTCMANCRWAPFCGDGVVDTLLGGEQCDGTNLGGRTCADLDGDGLKEPGDFDGGTLSCVDCGLDTSGCYFCGNGMKDGTEECDGVGLCGDESDCGGLTCEDFGFPTTSGLSCRADCTLDLSGCDTMTCGNGVIDGDEVCDGDSLGNRDCTDLDGDDEHGEPGDYSGGVLACTEDCTLDVSGCEYCGDGIINGGELCDGTDLAGVTCESLGYAGGGTLVCNATCDGYDESGCQECDDCTDCEGLGPSMAACMNHECGACLTTADCCAPLICSAGECVGCIPIGGICTDSADCCEGLCFDVGDGPRCWQF